MVKPSTPFVPNFYIFKSMQMCQKDMVLQIKNLEPQIELVFPVRDTSRADPSHKEVCNISVYFIPWDGKEGIRGCSNILS